MGKVTIDEETLDGIGQAIIAKGGATGPMTPAQMPAAIENIPSGGGESSAPSDVNFYMPDGTIEKSYTADEFAELTALPDQPTLDGLIEQGWNWTLADAKTYVASYGKLNIGGMYVTDNGETRLYLTIAEPYRLEQPLRFGRSGGTGITVDWGDGSTPVTYTHTSQTTVKHTYPGVGDYVIRISSVDAAVILLSDDSSNNIFGGTTDSESSPARVFSTRLMKVEIGSSVTTIGNRTFSNCHSLLSVTIPSSVTSIFGYAFYYCHSLSYITIPPSVTSIGSYAFFDCYSLSSVTIPPSVTTFGEAAFHSCVSLQSVTIPPSVRRIGISSFSNCSSFSSITIPSGVGFIGQSAFSGCYSLLSVTIPSSVTSLGVSAFNSCVSLQSVTIPPSVTSIGNLSFSGCSSLRSVTIPPSVTSLGNGSFSNCSSFLSVTIPSSVTRIGSTAFAKCYCVAKYDFTEHSQVPTLSDVNAFNNIATDCKIVVPDALYDTWIAATNWSDASIVGHIVKASEYVEA